MKRAKQILTYFIPGLVLAASAIAYRICWCDFFMYTTAGIFGLLILAILFGFFRGLYNNYRDR